MKPIIKIVLSILFLLCLLKMPYGYFQFVRYIGMLGFALLAYYDFGRTDKTLSIIWIALAILINPFFKIALGRTIWNIVDIVLAVVLLTTIIVDYKNRK